MKRRWLLWLLIFVFVWIVISRFTEIRKLIDLLGQGQWQWVAAAALFQVLYYVLYAALYQSSFHTVEVRSRVGELLPVLLSSVFVNVVAPSGGASTVALFSDDASRRGESGARAAIGSLLTLAADLLAFSLILGIGLAYLYLQQDLETYHIVGTIVLIIFIGGLLGIILLGLWRPLQLRLLLDWIQRTANALAVRLRRGPLLASDWAEHTTDEFSEAGLAVVTYPRRVGHALTMGLCVHLASLASLYCLFLAFNQPIKFGPLVAGFSIGTLFLIVSPTPMGIGVVEGVMVLVFNSLGVPTETAAVITIAFRGLSLWMPLAIGFFLLRRVKSFGAEEYSRAESSSVKAVAVLTALMGGINLLSSLVPSGPSRLAFMAQWSPLELSHAGHLITALCGFVLLLLAIGLWRRWWAAWLLTLIALDVTIITHLLKGLDYEEVIIATALATWLWALNGHFHSRFSRLTWKHGLAVLGAGVAYAWLYSELGFVLLAGSLLPVPVPHRGLLFPLVAYSPLLAQWLVPTDGFAQYFLLSIPLVFVASCSIGLFMLVYSVSKRRPPAPIDTERALAVIAAHPTNRLSPLVLRDDKRLFFSTKDCLIPYSVRGRVALALGDPVAAEDDVPGAVDEYLTFCQRSGWVPAFHQVGTSFVSACARLGLETIQVGREAIVGLAGYSLSDTLCRHEAALTESGFSAQVCLPPQPPDLLRTMTLISDEWLTTQRETEKRFSLGWFEEAHVRDTVVVIAREPEGAIASFANLAPTFGRCHISLDLVRLRHNASPRLAEFMVTRLVRWSQSEGYGTLSLGISPDPVAEVPAGGPEHDPARHYLTEHLRRVYGFHLSEGVRDAFLPRWAPQFLAYSGRADLPAVVLALIRTDGSGRPGWIRQQTG